MTDATSPLDPAAILDELKKELERIDSLGNKMETAAKETTNLSNLIKQLEVATKSLTTQAGFLASEAATVAKITTGVEALGSTIGGMAATVPKQISAAIEQSNLANLPQTMLSHIGKSCAATEAAVSAIGDGAHAAFMDVFLKHGWRQPNPKATPLATHINNAKSFLQELQTFAGNVGVPASPTLNNLLSSLDIYTGLDSLLVSQLEAHFADLDTATPAAALATLNQGYAAQATSVARAAKPDSASAEADEDEEDAKVMAEVMRITTAQIVLLTIKTVFETVDRCIEMNGIVETGAAAGPRFSFGVAAGAAADVGALVTFNLKGPVQVRVRILGTLLTVFGNGMQLACSWMDAILWRRSMGVLTDLPATRSPS